MNKSEKEKNGMRVKMTDKTEKTGLISTSSTEVDFCIESLFEETPKNGDVPGSGECRLIITSRFKNDVASLPSNKRNKVDGLIKEWITLSPGEIRKQLVMHNSKKFKGIEPTTFKFRVTEAERIVFTYGNTVTNNDLLFPSDIIFLAYVEIHDEQESIATDSRKDVNRGKVSFEKLVKTVKDVVESSYKDIFEIVQPLYFAATDLPILSNEQQGFIKINPPAIFRGSAGSGKTILSLEFYRKLYESQSEIAYITLTKNMQKHAVDLLIKGGIDSPHCFTFDEFCGDGFQDKKLEERPERFVEVSAKDKKHHPNLTEANCYTYIRGIIKGSILNGERKNFTGLISFEEFLSFARKEKLSDDEIKIIYDVAKNYQAKLDKEKRYDDNDTASYLLRNPRNFDCLIVDEVQDLTELQLLALINCCPSNQIFFFGDPNQIINPTIVDFGRIEGIFFRQYKEEEQYKIDHRVLKKTWRCGPHLIEYINKLSKLRQSFIGKQDYLDDEYEISMRQGLDETYWATYIDKKETVDKVLDFANVSTDCIIIVNDNEALEQLESRIPDIKGRVFTVSGIKGLEYRDVILYNLISDNENYFSEMISGSARRSTIHRMVFNKYYVACTRAQDRLFICENKSYDKEIYKRIFSDNGISPNNDYLTLLNLISTTKNREEWLKEGLRLKMNGSYKQAKVAYERAGDEVGALACQFYIDYQSEMEKNNNKEDERRLISEYASNFFDVLEYEKALELFEKVGDSYGLKLVEKCLGGDVDRTTLRNSIQRYSKFNKDTFISLGNTDYIDDGNKEISKLISEIKQLKEI